MQLTEIATLWQATNTMDQCSIWGIKNLTMAQQSCFEILSKFKQSKQQYSDKLHRTTMLKDNNGQYFVLYLQLLLVFACHCRIHFDFWWRKSWHGNKLEVWITGEFSCQPQERLLKVVVALRTDVIVLQTCHILTFIIANLLSLTTLLYFIHPMMIQKCQK